MINVGWLGRDSVYPKGSVDQSARLELLRLAADPVNVMRGFHDCELCNDESPIRIAPVQGVHGRISLGTGEIHVVGDGGVVYAAPTLIIHYIDKHGYRPPDVFLSALIGHHD
jgi:hypothetical protein